MNQRAFKGLDLHPEESGELEPVKQPKDWTWAAIVAVLAAATLIAALWLAMGR